MDRVKAAWPTVCVETWGADFWGSGKKTHWVFLKEPEHSNRANFWKYYRENPEQQVTKTGIEVNGKQRGLTVENLTLKMQSKERKLDEPLARINKEKEEKGKKEYQNTKCRLKGGTTINPT